MDQPAQSPKQTNRKKILFVVFVIICGFLIGFFLFLKKDKGTPAPVNVELPKDEEPAASPFFKSFLYGTVKGVDIAGGTVSVEVDDPRRNYNLIISENTEIFIDGVKADISSFSLEEKVGVYSLESTLDDSQSYRASAIHIMKPVEAGKEFGAQ